MFLFISFKGGFSMPKILSFKYISCSYLSSARGGLFLSINPFKYISCSYLSLLHIQYPFSYHIQIHLMFLFITLLSLLTLLASNSNTSHVLIYLYYAGNGCWYDLNSNTSHVLIYHSPVNNNSYALHIFKYISCSYLSKSQIRTGR